MIMRMIIIMTMIMMIMMVMMILMLMRMDRTISTVIHHFNQSVQHLHKHLARRLRIHWHELLSAV